MHRIAFYVFPDFQLLDLSGPLAAFQRLDQLAPEQAYDLRVLSRQGGGVRSTAGITIDTSKPGRAVVDTLIVVGGRGAHQVAGQHEERDTVRRLARRADRVASVCTGAV
ncbi:AraC family transcriptional regulator, partial [Alcanivorax xiamenensis]